MKLPPKCHVSHGAIFYVHRNKWTRLCDADASISEVYKALSEATRPPPPRTIDGLLDGYIERGLPQKKPTTQKSYLARLPRLRKHFGKMAIEDLESMHVAMFLEGRRNQGHGPGGNRESAVLAAAFDFGMRQGWCKVNPCRGVRRNTEKPRRRFIRDREWAEALQRAHPPFALLLMAAELTGLRQGDLRALTWDQVTPDGLEIEESKTGKRLVIEWSTELAYIFGWARWLMPWRGIVFRDAWGQPWGVWGIQSAMRRLGVDWTFHDLRARAESLHPHGMGLLARYKRARRIVPRG